MAWLYVPGLEGLNSELNESSLTSETWLSWRAKPSPFQTWSKRWKRVPWLRRLSGLTCEPSRADDFAEKWISSQQDSHASLSHTLADFKEQKISATFGPMFQGSSAKLDPQSLCWKTSQVSLVSQARLSLRTWPKWGLIVRGELYELQKPAHLTEERDSLPFVWPTITTNDHKRAPYQIADGKRYPTLNGAVKNWPTPTTDSTTIRTKKYAQGGLPLSMAVQEVLTPTNHTNQQSGHLNPEWVEWLMGWPIGWTESAPAETESSPSKRN